MSNTRDKSKKPAQPRFILNIKDSTGKLHDTRNVDDQRLKLPTGAADLWLTVSNQEPLLLSQKLEHFEGDEVLNARPFGEGKYLLEFDPDPERRIVIRQKFIARDSKAEQYGDKTWRHETGKRNKDRLELTSWILAPGLWILNVTGYLFLKYRVTEGSPLLPLGIVVDEMKFCLEVEDIVEESRTKKGKKPIREPASYNEPAYVTEPHTPRVILHVKDSTEKVYDTSNAGNSPRNPLNLHEGFAKMWLTLSNQDPLPDSQTFEYVDGKLGNGCDLTCFDPRNSRETMEAMIPLDDKAQHNVLMVDDGMSAKTEDRVDLLCWNLLPGFWTFHWHDKLDLKGRDKDKNSEASAHTSLEFWFNIEEKKVNVKKSLQQPAKQYQSAYYVEDTTGKIRTGH